MINRIARRITTIVQSMHDKDIYRCLSLSLVQYLVSYYPMISIIPEGSYLNTGSRRSLLSVAYNHHIIFRDLQLIVTGVVS